MAYRSAGYCFWAEVLTELTDEQGQDATCSRVRSTRVAFDTTGTFELYDDLCAHSHTVHPFGLTSMTLPP